jgi:nicotinate phosphoribosyltransferase
MIYDELTGPPQSRVLVDIADVTIRRKIPDSAAHHDLLVPVFRRGELVYDRPSIHETRDRAQSELGRFYSGVKRLLNPHIYPVGLELGLHEAKTRLIQEARNQAIGNNSSPSLWRTRKAERDHGIGITRKTTTRRRSS